MRFGVHIRMDRGLIRALDRAQELRCEAVQLFSGNPTGWARKPLDPDLAARFAEKAASLDIRPIIVHTPYLVNLAAPDVPIWTRSRDVLADAVLRAPMLGGSLVATHIGSHKATGYEQGLDRIVEAVRFALDADERVTVALELGAGAGSSIGSRLEEAARIIARLDGHERVGIAIDTAHLYGAGYDVSNAGGVNAMFDELSRLVGFKRLKLVHLNDTLVDLGSRRDRHHHIGRGKIGREGFRAIVNYPGAQDLPGIIETPADDPRWDRRNLAVLRKLAL